jgi:uncharacterized protein involved in type VI secretion and phage assembly
MNPEILQQLLTPADPPQRFYGVVVGVVTNNKDPEDLHRVKVRFPWLDGANESHWARVAAPMAGNDRGAYFLPEVEDEVLVAFEHGCVDYPYVVGALWNGKDKPPESNSDGLNKHRTIKSRSGHVIRLNDKGGSETIEIIDKSGNNKIVVSTQDNTITIEAQSDISISSKTGKLKMSAVGVEINSKADVKIEATGNTDVSANAFVNVKGAMIKLN